MLECVSEEKYIDSEGVAAGSGSLVAEGLAWERAALGRWSSKP